MKHKIRSEDFEKLLYSLANDVVEANIYFKLNLDINSEKKDYLKELNESSAFWWLTLNALRETALIRLCRVYEKNSNSNNLPNFLEKIKANLDFFNKQSFKIRQKENPHIENLAKYPRTVDIKQLELDINFASEKKNSLVKNLIMWRHKSIAHRSPSVILKKFDLSAKHPLPTRDILKLLENGIEIINRYSNLFNATTYSTQIVGYDDYKHVLRSIKNELKRHEEEIEKEFQKYNSPN